ncbi:MAG: carbonate dehydratase [Cyanobacteria bacterium M5B4]|nr:MAG: carbonate dehydratase [Cyanobacteria bacterium M5B4]
MQELIEGVRDFRNRYFCTHQDLFEQLAKGQHPKVLFITCSDSRIDPNMLVDADLGELFVIRNAGNIVPHYSNSKGGEGATIEYALKALEVDEVIVCGHTHCGAMKGLFKLEKLKKEMPLVYEWLLHAEETRRVIKDKCTTCNEEELVELAVAENVLTQLENLRSYPIVQEKLRAGKLNLYGWIYDIETGNVLIYNPDRGQFLPAFTDPAICELPVRSWIAPEQQDRIYRGSTR